MNRNIIHSTTLVFFAGVLFTACGKKSGPEPAPPPVPTVTAEITVNATDIKQVIEGFGCASAFAPPNTTNYTNEELVRLFGNGTGQVGLNIFRIRIGTDDAWRATELGYSKVAKQQGARILATPWTPPANMKTNNSLIGGSLKTDSGAAYAKYLNDFAAYMAANGAPLYAVSIQNEPDITVTYESCDWTAIQMRDFLKNYGQLITNALVVAPESFNNNQNYVNTILSDNGAAANVDIIGGHIYGSGIVENAMAKTLGKPVWMTEHLDTTTSYYGSLQTAVEVHDCLTKANFNAYVWWYGKRFYGLIGQDGQMTKRGYLMSQFARFIPLNSVRINTGTNTQTGVFISAYKTPAGKKVMVAVNNLAANVDQKITVNGASLADVIPYTTTEKDNVLQGAKITVSAGSLSFKLPPLSVTTFVEQ